MVILKSPPSHGLALLVCLILLLGGCGGNAPGAATSFIHQGAKVVPDITPAPLPAPAAAPTPAAAPAKPEAPARLTLQEAMGHALRKNQKIQVNAFNPQRAAQDLKGAEAVYDSSLFSTGNLGRVKRPTASLLDTGTLLEDKLIEDKWLMRAGAKKPLPTGATVSVYQEMDRLNSNSTLVTPDPQSTSRLVFEVSQPLLKGFWDKTNKAIISIARFNLDISNEEFRQTVMDVVNEVAKVYWQLVMEREFSFIAATTLDMAEEVLRREQTRMGSGVSTQLDADRALAAANTRRADLLRSQTRVKMLSDQLKLMLNLPESMPEIIPTEKPVNVPAPVDQDEALAAALKHRPELERAQKNIGVARERQEVARNNRLPKLDAVFRLTKNGLGGTTGRAFDTTYDQANNSWLAGVEFEYPWGGRAAQAEYDKRLAEQRQAETEARRVKDQVANEVTLAIREIHLAQKEIPITLKAKNAAERVVVSEHARFELGQKTNEELLRAQDLLANAAREYVRSVLNYNISRSGLDRAKGTILKEAAIAIQE
jgi:outer membrane protein TolC